MSTPKGEAWQKETEAISIPIKCYLGHVLSPLHEWEAEFSVVEFLWFFSRNRMIHHSWTLREKKTKPKPFKRLCEGHSGIEKFQRGTRHILDLPQMNCGIIECLKVCHMWQNTDKWNNPYWWYREGKKLAAWSKVSINLFNLVENNASCLEIFF